jgi:hypothetical protein
MHEFEEEHRRYCEALRKLETATRILKYITREANSDNAAALTLFAKALELASEADSLWPEFWQRKKNEA